MIYRNSCFAGPEYEVGDGVFDVRVCQFDTPIGENYARQKQVLIFFENFLKIKWVFCIYMI